MTTSGPIALITFSKRDQEQVQVFSTKINRDCAPWDGAAFTVSISYRPASDIYVSIWQQPDKNFPSAFTFPDETGRIGYVYILPEIDPLIQLRGKVNFQRIERGIPVEGSFDFQDESGHRYKGKFIAEWGNEAVVCG